MVGRKLGSLLGLAIFAQCMIHKSLSDLQVDQQHVIVDYKAGKVSCSDDALRSRVETAMQRLVEAMNPVTVDGQ